MRVNILLLLVLLSSVTFSVFGQNGSIRGVVFDEKTGEYLPGVTIFIEGTATGTITDLDGEFNMGLAPGVYTLRVSFISYETLNIQDVEVKPNEVSFIGNVKLKEATIELGEATVTASFVRNTETAMLAMKSRSVNLLDAISSDNFKKIGDSNAAASVKRVPGISVEGGKYVYVRGLGDRYTKTILNGLDIPGLDPDRNTLQMDIFPTNLIENIIVNKSFSADLPADFTGGVININIKDFPESKTASFSFDIGYDPGSHFNNNFLTYEGSKTDFLGFDNGKRAIPVSENIPLFTEAVSNPNGERALLYKEILGSFDPTLAASKKQSFMDYSFSFNYGNQLALRKYTLGYIFAASYKSSTEFYTDAEFGRYGLYGDKDRYEMERREFLIGDYGISDVLLSGLAGFALKTKKSKIRFNIMHLQNGESEAGVFDYFGSDQGSVFNGFQHNLEYSQRSLTSLLFDGKHVNNSSGWELEWKLSPTLSSLYDPDNRFTRYEDRGKIYHIGTEVGFPERIWRELDETNLSGVLHITKAFQVNNKPAKLKFGGAYTYKERDYLIRSFAMNIRNVSLIGDPNEIFWPENLWPLNGNISRGTTYEAPFIPINPNQYNATVNNTAAYLSFEFTPIGKLKTIVGVRAENYVQNYTGQDQLGQNILNNEEVLNNLNLFPTINIIYPVSESQNLRFSYAKTIARPSLKELSYAEIFDPISGRIFIGGLFRDANDVAGIEYWDGNLQSTDIHNFDFRWETFMQGGQTVSASFFYKKFNHPIEMIQFATQTGAFQPRNVGDGQVAGFEFEIRQNFDIISDALKNFSFVSNITITRSRIELSNTEYNSRLENARTGQNVNKYRDMAGQAPHIINAGISYSGNSEGVWKGLDAGLFYNVQGQTLQYVGIVDRPDIYTVPFHSLNFNGTKKIGKDEKLHVGLKVDNILNQKRQSVFISHNATKQFFSNLNPGTTYQLKLSYTIF